MRLTVLTLLCLALVLAMPGAAQSPVPDREQSNPPVGPSQHEDSMIVAGRDGKFKILFRERGGGPMDRGFVPRYEAAFGVHAYVQYRYWWAGRQWEMSSAWMAVKDAEDALKFYQARMPSMHEFKGADGRGIPTVYLCSADRPGIVPRPGDTLLVRLGIGSGMGGGTYHEDRPGLLSVDVVQPVGSR